jgi:hypothetical protein
MALEPVVQQIPPRASVDEEVLMGMHFDTGPEISSAKSAMQ